MKTDFLKFQLSKNEMNELRGGVQRCHCGGNDNYFNVTIDDEEEESFDSLDDVLSELCGDAGWGCTPIR